MISPVEQPLDVVEEKTFGSYLPPEDGEEYLIIHFSPTSIPLRQRWRNTGLSADFLAEYWATFFPKSDILTQDRQLEIRESIRYIANELLENLMKFSYESANHPVGLALYLYQDAFRFYATNAIDPETVEPFQARIQKLLSQDIDTLYMQQLEKNVRDDNHTQSHLGLLTIMHDYDARTAWKFEKHSAEEAEVTLVTTMVQLAI